MGRETITLVVLVAVIFIGGLFTGYQYAKRSVDKAVIKQQQKDAKAVQKHDAATKLVVKEVEKIKVVVRKVYDPSGCLDTAIPVDADKQLRNAYRTSRSASD